MSGPSVGAAGAVKETVSRSRIVPAGELQREATARTTPEFWNYIEALTTDQWSDHVLYIYRVEPAPANYSGGPSVLEKCVGAIDVNGARVSLDDREAVELAIKQKYGGKAFRLILKKGRERVTEGKCSNELPPRYPAESQQPYGAAAPPQPGTQDAVAIKAMDTVANQNPAAIALAMDILSKSAEVISRAAKPPDGHANLVDQQVITTLLQKALNPPPPPDPLHELERLKVLRDLFAPATSGVKDALELMSAIGNSPFFKMRNGGSSGAWDLLAGAVPQVASAVTSSMHEWRMGMEAQERGALILKGMPPAVNVTTERPALPAPAPNPEAQPAAAEASGAPQPQPEGAQAVSGDPPFQWTAQKIVDILKQNQTVDYTVDAVMAFLDVSSPSLIGKLVDPPKIDPRLKPGEEGLLMLFQHYPVLQQVPVNPRLTEFIKQFFAAANKYEAERLMTPGTKPEPPQPAS